MYGILQLQMLHLQKENNLNGEAQSVSLQYNQLNIAFSRAIITHDM